MIGPSTGCSQSGWRQTVLPEWGLFSLSILFFFVAFFLFSFQISTSVLAIDTTATPTRCAPTLRALIIAFVKKATSVTDFSARKKAIKRKERNQDAQSKKEKGCYWWFPYIILGLKHVKWPLLTVSLHYLVRDFSRVSWSPYTLQLAWNFRCFLKALNFK